MKRILKIAAFAFVLVLGSSLRTTVSAQYNDQYNDRNNDQYNDQDRDVSYQTFYDELSPHGRWVDYPGQGYVWVPDAEEDFRPYSTNGHWVWSDNYEWMWVSDYDWGWAPFHYGRWDHDQYYGWYWVPGYEWSPAWVAWRDGGDYYGWAPIRPGISININFNIGRYSPPVDFWCFAPRRYITSPRIHDYYIDRRQNVTIINYTTIINNNYQYGNNYGFRSGPRRYDAERYCGRINPVSFRQASQPGRTTFRNNEVSIYRPNVRRDENRNYTPRTFERYDRNSNSGFRGNGNDNRRDVNTRDNNQPVRRERNNNSGFERRNDNVRQPQDNNGNNNRRLERNDNNGNNQTGRIENRREGRQPERTDRTFNPGGNNGNNDNRRFERTDNNGNGNRPDRQPEIRRNENNIPERKPQQMERGQETRPQPQFERRQEPRPQPQETIDRRPQQQMERRQETRQQQPQFERRQESRQQPVERKQDQPPTRQFERRDDGNRQQNNNSVGNNDNRNSRKRF